jgi:hypothetical protein
VCDYGTAIVVALKNQFYLANSCEVSSSLNLSSKYLFRVGLGIVVETQRTKC